MSDPIPQEHTELVDIAESVNDVSDGIKKRKRRRKKFDSLTSIESEDCVVRTDGQTSLKTEADDEILENGVDVSKCKRNKKKRRRNYE